MNVPGVRGEEKERRVHMQQRLITVDKTEVENLQWRLNMLTREANAANAESTLMEIKACQKLLFNAMGVLQAMKQLELLPKEEIKLIREDHNRINNKILNILEEKRKASRGLASK